MEEYVLSLSYGKDSLACLFAIEQLGWPLDRIIHAEVWATDDIPADPPPMVEFKATDTAKALASGDTAKVFANQQKFLEDYAKTVKADALKKTPKPPAGDGTHAMTREDIMKIKDSAERQSAIAANMELFRKGE